MTFELPANITTSAELRDLEQNAPNVTPKGVRAALVSAAKLIEVHENKAADAARIIEEALRLRVSQMDSPSRAIEIDRAVKNAMNQALVRLRS
jgi:hypothetical protein